MFNSLDWLTNEEVVPERDVLYVGPVEALFLLHKEKNPAMEEDAEIVDCIADECEEREEKDIVNKEPVLSEEEEWMDLVL